MINRFQTLLSILHLRRYIEWIVVKLFPPRTCRKLIKDVAKSARRKSERAAWETAGLCPKVLSIGRTAMRAIAISALGRVLQAETRVGT